jgi:hypothetical protein
LETNAGRLWPQSGQGLAAVHQLALALFTFMNADTLHQLGITTSHAITWGLPQLILAVLIVLAGRRHRLIGLWFLAATAILSLCVRVAATAIIVFSDPRPGVAKVNGYAYLLIFLLSIIGWAAFAFIGTKKSDHHA